MSVQVLFIPDYVPTSLNLSVGRHWSIKAKQKKGDRELIAFYAREQGIVPALHTDYVVVTTKTRRRVSIHVVWPKGQRMIDRDNSIKGIFDGLTHAGLIVNDSPAWCELGKIEYARSTGTLRETFIILEDVG